MLLIDCSELNMDRWADDVTTPSSKRAPDFSSGKDLSSFVKSQGSNPATAPAQVQPSAVIIQPSKRAQAEEAARQTASRLAASVAPASSSKLPAWATQSPPPGYYLEVVKEGAVLQEVPLTKPATLLGRSPGADLLLDHASISRQHAAVCWHPASSSVVLVDLGSVHGSWVDGQPARSGTPVQLRPGSELRLGASTRHYFLRRRAGEQDAGPSQHPPWHQQPQHAQPGEGPGPGREAAVGAGAGAKRQGGGEAGHEQGHGQAQRKRLRFADEGGEGGLEQTIGYASKGGFNLVGPRPVKGAVEGRFGDLVQSKTLPEPKLEASGSGSGEGGGGGNTPRAGAQGGGGAGRGGIGLLGSTSQPGVRSAMNSLFNKKVQQGRLQQQQQGPGSGGAGALFAGLPPPAKS